MSRTRIDAEAPLRVRSLLSHCACVTTALTRDRHTWLFFRKELPFAGYSVVKELLILLRYAAVASSTRQIRNLVVLAANRHHAGLPDMVENTGLEPVTSWLQTRRSPS